jgi:hypothetical protein
MISKTTTSSTAVLSMKALLQAPSQMTNLVTSMPKPAV